MPSARSSGMCSAESLNESTPPTCKHSVCFPSAWLWSWNATPSIRTFAGAGEFWPGNLATQGCCWPLALLDNRRADVATEYGDVPATANTERVRIDVAEDDAVLGPAVEPIVVERPDHHVSVLDAARQVLETGNPHGRPSRRFEHHDRFAPRSWAGEDRLGRIRATRDLNYLTGQSDPIRMVERPTRRRSCTRVCVVARSGHPEAGTRDRYPWGKPIAGRVSGARGGSRRSRQRPQRATRSPGRA